MSNLYVPLGIPGCGKSTLGMAYAEKGCQVVSPDEIRVGLTGDINNQSQNEAVFAEAHYQIQKNLSAGNDVYFDATNVSRRTDIWENLAYYKVKPDKMTLIVFDNLAEAMIRNEQRERKVPKHAMNRMARNFVSSLQDIGMEPWDYIEFRRG